MSRSLTLGNGSVMVCLDRFGQVKDFYFPYPGLENQIGEGRAHRIGVWVDGIFRWIDSPEWQISIDYRDETMVSSVTATNPVLQVTLNLIDVVYNEKDIFVRQIDVHNLADHDRTIKLYFNQQFYIYGTNRRDTAYYDPERHVLIHYEGRRILVIGGMSGGGNFDDYSVGIFGDDGREGTWKDAEDGRLEQNPIEHGSVDSVLGFTLAVPARGSARAQYWITVAKLFQQAVDLDAFVREATPGHILETTEDFWHAWVNKTPMDFHGLDEKIVDLYKKSLLVIRSHAANNGALIASGDSDMPWGGRDTYAYVWPRDAAFVVLALDRAGYHDQSRRFFDFCHEVISDGGYFFHKYRPDGSIGSSWHPWIKDGVEQLAIQEDETALIIYALWEHYVRTLDLDFIEGIYNDVIKQAAEFMCRYMEESTGLPLGSYDIWEEKFGTATFTAGTVVAGLEAAHRFAELLGKEADAARYLFLADRVRKATLKHLFNEKKNFFYRYLERSDGRMIFHETLDMSSFLGVFRFRLLAVDDPRMVAMADVVRRELSNDSPIGGVIRYQGDRYFQIDDWQTENPWCITTLWEAQYLIAAAGTADDLLPALDRLRWIVRFASPSGMLPEQVNRHTGEPLSVAPLVWSHAEFILTVLDYLEKTEELAKRQGH